MAKTQNFYLRNKGRVLLGQSFRLFDLQGQPIFDAISHILNIPKQVFLLINLVGVCSGIPILNSIPLSLLLVTEEIHAFLELLSHRGRPFSTPSHQMGELRIKFSASRFNGQIFLESLVVIRGKLFANQNVFQIDLIAKSLR